MDLNHAVQKKRLFHARKTIAKKHVAAKIKNVLMDRVQKIKKLVLAKAAKRNLNRC